MRNPVSHIAAVVRVSLTVALTFIVGIVTAYSQQSLKWSVDFNTIFENREGDDYYSPDQTIFLTRLSPEVGISMLGGKHNLSGGVSWIQPCGNGWRDYKLCPTLYYQFKSETWRFAFGMMPRTLLMEPMHTVEWSDSMTYYQPNIRGVLLQYVKPKGFFELSLDWRSLQTDTQREAFNVNFSGQWRPKGALILGGRMHLNHLAKTRINNETQNVNDDIMLNPYVGLDLARHTALDSFVIKAGPILQMERDRGQGDWHKPAGVLIDAVAEWKWLGVKETFYAGDNLYPLYPKYGSQFNMGDPNYQAKLYSRTNVYAYIFRNQFLNLEASLDFHYTKEAFAFWQKVVLRVYVDQLTYKSRKQKCTREEYLRNIY